MTILSRLRAWLSPYPDAAEMQTEMLRRVRVIARGKLFRHAWGAQQEIDRVCRLWASAGSFRGLAEWKAISSNSDPLSIAEWKLKTGGVK